MTRRIPGKSRHKLKPVDPCYKGPRNNHDKGFRLANRKPDRGDNQGTPSKLRMFMATLKHIEQKTIAQKREEQTQDVKDGPNIEPRQKKLPDVSDGHFLSRAEKCTKRTVSECNLKIKYSLKHAVQEKPDTDCASYVNRQSRNKGITEESSFTQKLSSLRRKRKLNALLKRKKKKLQAKREARRDEFGHLKDEVGFGEVVERPPELTDFSSKKGKTKSLDKPGKRDLLLKNLLKSKDLSDIKRDLRLRGAVMSNVDLTVKRKQLSLLNRQKLEAARLQALEVYRSTKKKINSEKSEDRKLERDGINILKSVNK